MRPLYETDHPYYMNEGMWNERDRHTVYESWAEYLEDWDGLEADLNLIFRWDWREGEDWGLPEGVARLMIYRVFQRKASLGSQEIKVSRDQEPEIRQWLAGHWEQMRRLWQPFSEGADS